MRGGSRQSGSPIGAKKDLKDASNVNRPPLTAGAQRPKV